MKQKAALLVVACAFLLAMVMSSRSFVNRSALGNTNHISINATLTADGGAPTPPLPPPSGLSATPAFLADGGAPTPPLPPPSGLAPTSTLVADGGAPTPPLPPPSGFQIGSQVSIA